MPAVIPKEEETIAAKRTERLRRRFHFKNNGANLSQSIKASTELEYLVLAVVAVLNFYLLYPLFGKSAFRVPFSGPAIPFLAGIVSALGIPFDYSTQIVYLVFSVFFPVSFYFFVKYVSGRKLVALLSVLIASLPVYPFAFTRVNAGFSGADGPHIASLTVVLVALVYLMQFLRIGEIKNLLITSLLAAGAALTSPFGVFVFAILGAIATMSEMLLGSGRLKLARFTSVIVMGASLTSFWYNPQFFFELLFGEVGAELRHMLVNLLPVSFFTVPIIVTFGYLLFDRKPHLQAFFIATFFTITFFLISAIEGIFPSRPSRYLAELGISFSFFFSIVTIKVMDMIRSGRIRLPGQLRMIKKGVLVNGATSFLLLASSSAILMARPNLYSRPVKVLGISDNIEKGDIWVARSEVHPVFDVFGYAVSAGSVCTLAVSIHKSRRKARITVE